MSAEEPPRVAMMGDNNPPPPTPEEFSARLELAHADLVKDAAALEMRAFGLPEAPANDEDAEKLQLFAVDAKKVIKRAENSHTAEKKPWLGLGKATDNFFSSLWNPLEARVKTAEAKLNAYQRAKAEKERAEARARADQERQEAEALARKQREAEEAARAEERKAEEAAAAIRAAASQAERDAAATAMNEAEQRAAAARAEAKDAGKEAANAERFADTLDRAAEGSVGQLGRVSAAGTSSATTKFWNHRVKDADALISSLGPLGPHLTNDAIQSAIGVAKRAAVASGTIADLIVPGVEFFEDSRTVARAAPAARAKA